MQTHYILMISYAIGMIPSAYFIVRAITGKDIRVIGTGNVGTMNTAVNFGILLGLFTLLVDLVKGYIVVTLSLRYASNQDLWTVALLFAVMAHVFNPLLSFSGGKGLATIAGGLLIVAPLMNIVLLLLALVLLILLRKPRVVPGVSIIFYPIILHFMGPSEGFMFGAILMCAVILLKHIPTFKEAYGSNEKPLESH